QRNAGFLRVLGTSLSFSMSHPAQRDRCSCAAAILHHDLKGSRARPNWFVKHHQCADTVLDLFLKINRSRKITYGKSSNGFVMLCGLLSQVHITTEHRKTADL